MLFNHVQPIFIIIRVQIPEQQQVVSFQLVYPWDQSFTAEVGR